MHLYLHVLSWTIKSEIIFYWGANNLLLEIACGRW